MQRTLGECFESHQSTSAFTELLKASNVSEDLVCTWLEKIVTWSSVSEVFVIQETTKELDELKGFLAELCSVLANIDDVGFLLKKIPSLGQLLGRLCGNTVLLSHRDTYCLLLKCVLRFKVDNPQTAVEVKAREWALSQLRNTVAYMKHEIALPCQGTTGHSGKEFNEKCLQVVRKELKEHLRAPCRKWSSLAQCYSPLPTKSTIPTEALSLGTSFFSLSKCCHLVEEIVIHLSRQPWLCEEERAFLDKVANTQRDAYQNGSSVKLSYKALVALWTTHLTSFEQEIIGLINHACCTEAPSVGSIKDLVASRGVPRACSEHTHLWRFALQIFLSFLSKTNHLGLVELFIVFCECVREHFRNLMQWSLTDLYGCEYRELVSLLNTDSLLKVTNECDLAVNQTEDIGRVLLKFDDAQYLDVWCHLVQFPEVYHKLVQRCCNENRQLSELQMTVLCMFHKPKSRQELQACVSRLSCNLTESHFSAQFTESALNDNSLQLAVKLVLMHIHLLRFSRTTPTQGGVQEFVECVKNVKLDQQMLAFIRTHLHKLDNLPATQKSVLLEIENTSVGHFR